MTNENKDNLRKEAVAAIADYEDMLTELQPLLDAIKPMTDRLAKREAAIKKLVLQLGEHVDGNLHTWQYRKGSTKPVMVVDADALFGYAVAHPEVERFITHSTSETKPSVAKTRRG